MYALQQALRTLRSHWVASIATVTTMTVSLTILAAFSLISINLSAVLQDLQSELEITAFLERDADGERLMNTVQTWSDVARTEFTGRDAALGELVADLPSLRTAATLVDNPLPDTITVRLFDPAQTPVIRDRLLALPGISDVEDGRDAVSTFLAVNDAFRVAGSIIIVILLGSALFAIQNSIRAAIQSRSREIEVMRLVGATRGFIRAPFLIEGFLLGLFAALATIVLAMPGYRYVVMRLTPEVPFLPLVRDPVVLGQIAVLLTVLAMLVGLVGSAIAVSQYLREEP